MSAMPALRAFAADAIHVLAALLLVSGLFLSAIDLAGGFAVFPGRTAFRTRLAAPLRP